MKFAIGEEVVLRSELDLSRESSDSGTRERRVSQGGAQ